MISNFLNKYDPDGSLRFDKIVYKPNSSFTDYMGIIMDDPSLTAIGKPIYFHLGTDRATVKEVLNPPIYAAFDGTPTFHKNVVGYGTFIILDVEGADFVVRSAHCPEMLVPDGVPVKAGTLLGYEGSLGKGTGRHTHTEIVSKGESSVICDYILEKKGLLDSEDTYDFVLNRLSEDYKKNKVKIDIMVDYKKAHSLKMINTNMVKRLNSFGDREPKTFYSSDSVFNKM